MSPPAPRYHALFGALALALLCIGLGACGKSANKSDLAEGQTVTLGQLKYNVLISRFLNPSDPEDVAYLAGEPRLGPKDLYLGVFLLIKNTGGSPVALPRGMTVTDTQNEVFRPVPNRSVFALRLGSDLPQRSQLPIPGSAAASGPTEGSMVLFRIPQSATENRPLKLSIPGTNGPAQFELDI